ncbi:MAG TPA: ABC transporter permease subunit [Kofleriaceae bacterium]
MSGKIHDLGYQRYAGPRRAAAQRWRVIARNLISTSWKGWARYKVAMFGAMATTLAAGAAMFVLKDNPVFNAFGDITTRFSNAIIPKSIEWFSRAAFILSVTVGTRIVATDLGSGAFVFYFSRSTRPRDYVLGKFVGLAVLVSTLSLAGPLVLAIVRLALASDASDAAQEVAHLLPNIPKAIAVGLLGTFVYSTVPVAFSTFARSSRTAMALWAAYYLVLCGIVSEIGEHTHSSWVGALDIPTAIDAVAMKLFHLDLFTGRAGYIDLAPALISLLAQGTLATIVVVAQIRRAHGSGVGGQT